MKNIVVLVSGSGTNLQSLIDGVEKGTINGKIVLVFSNKENAYALERAKKHNINTKFISSKEINREEYDNIVADEIEKYRPDLIVLAGYMRIFTPAFVNRFKNKIINIHPALLPSFGGEGYYGENVHKAVLEHGCKTSGCTVHIVDEKIDHGPIIIQKRVPVLDNDNHETLAKRVLEKEHQALVEAVKLFCDDKIKIHGIKVEILRE